MKPIGSSTKDCIWLIDSGASMHLSKIRKWFANFKPMTGKSVVLGDGRVIPVLGHGDIHVNITLFGRTSPCIFNNVLYVPDIAANLLSVSKMTEAGLNLSFNGQHCYIRSTSGDVIARAEKQDNCLYRVSVQPRAQSIESRQPAPVHLDVAVELNVASTNPSQDGRESAALQLAHKRMGHLNFKSLTMLRSHNMATDIPWPATVSKQDHGNLTDTPCESCQMGKSHRAAMPQAGVHRSKQPLELIHSDVCGPMRTASIGGQFIYFVTFIDDFTNFTVVYPMRSKSSTTMLQHFQAYKAYAENQTGKRIRCLRSDGEENISRKHLTIISANMASPGKLLHPTPPNTTAWQNEPIAR